jgi:hypothetical protein
MMLFSPFGERSLTVVAASFPDRHSAEDAVSALLHDAPDLQGEVAIIAPGDPLAGRKAEPENQGIWRTLIRSHILFGLAGALVGVLTALIVIAWPWPAAASSPAYTMLFIGAFGATFGLIFAGLLTLRPDHGYVLGKIREFSEHGRWSVVARPLNEGCSKAAYESLRQADAEAVRSL